MNTFASLLKYGKGKSPSDAQDRARSGFAGRVSQSKLRLRTPSVPISSVGRHFIIGVASYSSDELRLLDELDKALETGHLDADIEVFDVLDCQEMGDFAGFVPGLDRVQRTPVLGVISDGRLVDHATGLDDVKSTLHRFSVLSHS
jgi:hypothetical protein